VRGHASETLRAMRWMGVQGGTPYLGEILSQRKTARTWVAMAEAGRRADRAQAGSRAEQAAKAEAWEHVRSILDDIDMTEGEFRALCSARDPRSSWGWY
jgi:hypothetical protein